MSTSTFELDKISDARAIAAGILLYMLAPLGMTLIPLTVGAAATDLGFTNSEVGYLASVDLAGLAFVSVTAAIWVRRYSWHTIALTSLIVIMVGNGLSIVSDSFTTLCIARFITEMGSGGIYALALVTLGETRTPDRFFSYGIGSTIAVSVAVFLWYPALIAQYGIDVIFLSHIFLAAAVIPVVFWLPKFVEVQAAPTTEGDDRNLIPLIICFIGFSCIMLAEGGLWSYVERMGSSYGLDADYVGEVLATTQVASFIAAMLASTFGARYGRTWPIVLGMAAFLLSLYLLLIPDATLFMIGACLSQFAWIFVLPFMMAMCVELDTSGRYYVLITAFKMAGFSLGPAIIATFLGVGGMDQDFAIVSWVSGFFLVLSLILYLPLAIKLDGERQQEPMV